MVLHGWGPFGLPRCLRQHAETVSDSKTSSRDVCGRCGSVCMESLWKGLLEADQEVSAWATHELPASVTQVAVTPNLDSNIGTSEPLRLRSSYGAFPSCARHGHYGALLR